LLADTVRLSVESIGRRITAALDDFQAGCPFDDITLLILRRRT
jgi:serine phosphatase RsbU (regulator of sigma subunit)